MIPKKVEIREVGPRDGWQMEREFIPTHRKAALIRQMVAAGLRKIEITSFVNPQVVSQLRDAEELAGLLGDWREANFSALILNEKGLERAVGAGIKEVLMVVSASETHSGYNVRMGIKAALTQLQRISRQAAAAGVRVRGAVGVAFGCPYEGPIAPAALEKIVDVMHETGIKQITLGDTAGLAHPLQVRTLFRRLKERYPGQIWGLHFHDTRGLGLANIYAGLEEGISLLETSVGGLGGCPFVPRAAGNVATEDLVNMLAMMGVATGVDLEKLVKLAQEIQQMLGRPLPSRLLGLA